MVTTSKTRKRTQQFKIKKILKKKSGTIIHSGMAPLTKKRFLSLLTILTMIQVINYEITIAIRMRMMNKMARKEVQIFWPRKKLMRPCRFKIILILFWSKRLIYLVWIIMMLIVMHSSFTEKWTTFLQKCHKKMILKSKSSNASKLSWLPSKLQTPAFYPI